MEYGLDGRVSISDKGKRFYLLHRVEAETTKLLCYGCRGIFPRVQSGRAVKVNTKLHLVPRSRIIEVYLHYPIRHGVVHN
jgi:hypothetical protein